MADDSHNKLVEVVGKAPSREWIEEFFEYANELLSYEEIDHHKGDDRLVISVQSDRIAITMNSRYVLVAFFNKERIKFMVREGNGLPLIRSSFVEPKQFLFYVLESRPCLVTVGRPPNDYLAS